MKKKKAQFKAKSSFYTYPYFHFISIFFVRFINNTLQKIKLLNFLIMKLKVHEKAFSELKKLIKEKRSIETSTGSMNTRSSNQLDTLKVLNAIKYSINKNVAIESISIKEGENVIIEGQSNSDII